MTSTYTRANWTPRVPSPANPSNLLHPKPVPAERFTWDKATRMYSAEASDLKGDLGNYLFGQVYKDAVDEGLTLVSRYARSTEVVFVVEHEERRDGDTLWWDLRPADLRQRKVLDVTVRVYND